METYPGSKRGNQRSVTSVILLMMLTSGFYMFYWYYVNINELETRFDFSGQGTTPDDVRKVLWIFIIINMASISLLSLIMVSESLMGKIVIILYFVSAMVGTTLNFRFLKLIQECYEYLNIENFNMGILIAVYLISLLGGGLTLTTSSPRPMIVFAVFFVLFINDVQKRLNILWRSA